MVKFSKKTINYIVYILNAELLINYFAFFVPEVFLCFLCVAFLPFGVFALALPALIIVVFSVPFFATDVISEALLTTENVNASKKIIKIVFIVRVLLLMFDDPKVKHEKSNKSYQLVNALLKFQRPFFSKYLYLRIQVRNTSLIR
jgi:hypothetical protein